MEMCYYSRIYNSGFITAVSVFGKGSNLYPMFPCIISVHIIFTDFDECASRGDNNCSTNAACTGGFTCTCNQG